MSRELDAQVAEKVMVFHIATKKFRRTNGWHKGYRWEDAKGNPVHHPGGGEFGWGWSGAKPSAPAYSTRIEDAWKVVEKLMDTPGPNGDHHCILIDAHSRSAIVLFDEGEDWEAKAEAPTLPEAICLAALKAVGA